MDLLAAMSTFLRVAERNSLSRAALDLGLAQASVSRHLQALEARYGTALLSRSTRRVRLTPAGEKLLVHAQGLLRSEGEIAADLQREARSLAGPLTIAAPMGFGHVVVTPLAVRLQSAHPGLQPRLLYSERRVNLIEEGVDLAIRIGEEADSSLVRIALGELDEVLVASPRLLGRLGAPDSVEALQAWPRLALSGLRAPMLRRGNARREWTAVPALVFDSSLAVRDAACGGAGIAAMHRYLVAEELAAGRLVRVLSDWKLPAWPLALVMPRRERSSRAEAFIGLLREAVKPWLASKPTRRPP
jgi:DNA-binding transcriptional LysR family regulator